MSGVRRGHPLFERLAAMAEARNIPVIDQMDVIRRHGAQTRDAHWAHDSHWNLAGHRWAAEALLDYLKRHPHLCDGAAAEESKGSRPLPAPRQGPDSARGAAKRRIEGAPPRIPNRAR